MDMPGLPKLDPIVVDAITEMLVSDQGMLRPPEKAAALLALVVALHETKEPFPSRAKVAKHINSSIATVDAALSTRLDEGYITQAIETTHGNVQRRNSALRQRYYIPSQKLLNTVRRARSAR